MTIIHHMTRKMAEKAGMTLAVMADDRVTCTWAERNQISIANTAPDALALGIFNQTLCLEYPAIRVRVATITDGNWELVAASDDALIGSFHDFPDLADVLEACEVAGIDPTAGLEEDEASGSVVPSRYRDEYKARGHANTCGDWLANLLILATTGKNGFDVSSFASILLENSVDTTGKWWQLPASGRPGWQGRYRMNGRQKLERRVIEQGCLLIDGVRHTPTPAEMAALRARHPNFEPDTGDVLA